MEFRCVDELDSAWLAARPVSYPTLKPAIYTADGWAEILTMPTHQGITTILRTATFTKSPDWSQEFEWRVATFKRPSDTGLFTDYPFDSSALAAVYLGPRIVDDDRAAIIGELARFRSAHAWTTTIGMSREFTFNQII